MKGKRVSSSDEQSPSKLTWPKSRILARLVALLRGGNNAARAIGRLITRRRRRERGPRTIFVTGASVGVGLHVARQLLSTEHRLVLTARASSMGRFAKEGILASERVLLVPLDVTSAESRKLAVQAAIERFGGVDVLINNAGISYRACAEHVPDEDLTEQLETNFLGPMALIRLVIPSMRARRHGHIINVSSVGGMTAMPTMSAYSASKFALEGASESLWYELRPWGIHVSVVRPGFINSDGFTKVKLTAEGERALVDPRDPYHRHYLNMTDLVGALMRLTFHDAEDVAETVAGLVDDPRPPLWVPGTLDATLFALMRRLLPQPVYLRLLYASLPRIWEWGDALPPAAAGAEDDARGE